MLQMWPGQSSTESAALGHILFNKVMLVCVEKKAANLLCVFKKLRVAQQMLTLMSFVFTLSAALDTDTHRLPTVSVVFDTAVSGVW